MREEDLRALVRDAVARHLRGGDEESHPAPIPSRHPSHVVLALQSGTDDGACVIEPDVRCTHCNYCRSYGH